MDYDVLNYREALLQHKTLILNFHGSSMRPLLYQNRDKVVVEEIEQYLTHSKLKVGDVVMFFRDKNGNGSTYVLHRILKINNDGTYWIIGDNCITGDIVTQDDIVAVMTEYLRGTKVCYPNGILYNCYVALWCRPYKIRIFLLKCRKILANIYHRFYN